MSFTTRCPACATMFKVVPDQLRISQGWVRCGQCDEVFDANAHLHEDIAAAHDEVDPVADDPTWAASTQPPRPTEIDPGIAALKFEPEPPVATAPEEAVAAPQSDALSLDDPATEPSLDAVHEPTELAPLREELRADTDAVPAHVQRGATGLGAPVEPPALSFLSGAQGESVWHRPWTRALLGLLGLILLGLLLIQVVVQERDRIAAYHPATQPALESLCDIWGCQLAPWRQIDAMVIDSSSFTKVRADVYRLNFSVKNTAPITVAMPALELTLTDMQDQAVMRRIISVQDMGSPQQALAPGGEFTTSLPILTTTTGSTERISGYRLLVFYP
jgi:predicted Zn finger-like uncharacterized protein